MPTLRTGDFTLRALPQMPRIDPAQFDARIGDLLNIYDQAMQEPARLEQVRATQRAGQIARATQPQTLELAKVQAAQNLELAPYEAAARKQKAVQSFDQPGGIEQYKDSEGNLWQAETTIREDPVTGEIERIVNPKLIKTAEQVAMERESASALTTVREANARAAEERAKAATTTAEAAKLRAVNVNGGRGRSVTRELKDRLGRSQGVVTYQFDPTGNLMKQYMTTPDGQTVEMQIPGVDEAASTDTGFSLAPPTTPAATASSPSPASVANAAPGAEIIAMAVNYPTPQSLLTAIRSGQVTPAQGREIARLNKFE